MPLVANRSAIAYWSASRTLMTTVPATAMAGQLDAVVGSANDTSGGLSDTEASDVAVNPTAPNPASAVTTTTPEAA
jgi:hypothetical protein